MANPSPKEKRLIVEFETLGVHEKLNVLRHMRIPQEVSLIERAQRSTDWNRLITSCGKPI